MKLEDDFDGEELKEGCWRFIDSTLENVTVFTLDNKYTQKGAMLVRPRPMCPQPKILGCCIPWTKYPLAIVPLTEPSHP